jgi:RNA recognition motif-containing protein
MQASRKTPTTKVVTKEIKSTEIAKPIESMVQLKSSIPAAKGKKTDAVKTEKTGGRVQKSDPKAPKSTPKSNPTRIVKSNKSPKWLPPRFSLRAKATPKYTPDVIPKFATTEEREEYTAERRSRIIVISNTPNGFWEKQAVSFFSQFDVVKNLRLLRSIKTGKARGVMFVEFESADAAKLIIEEMDCYCLGNKILRVGYYDKPLEGLFNVRKQEKLIALSETNPLLEIRKKAIAAHLDLIHLGDTKKQYEHDVRHREKRIRQHNEALEKAEINYKY